MSTSKRIVLLGGGHVHVQILKHFTQSPPKNVEAILISEEPKQLYSGMLPGLMGGYYAAEQCQFDLPKFCQSARVQFVQATASGLDLAAKKLYTDVGEFNYDWLSINVGSRPSLFESDPRLTPLKPLHVFYQKWQEILHQPHARVAILGGGVSGLEVGLMAAARLGPRVTIYEKSESVASNLPHRAQTILCEYAEKLKLKIQTRFDGTLSQIQADAIFLALPPQAPRWFRSTKLSLSADGFINVDKTLRAIDQPEVFAAGDCIEFTPSPHAHAGVYAVRHAEVLTENIRRTLNGQSPLREFHPQKDFLHLITLGGREALFIRRPFVFAAKLNWRLKDYIDRKYMGC